MISAYLTKIEQALASANALQTYFPMDKDQRKEQNLKLGREIGYGLGVFEDWKDYATTTYGRYIVRHSFDSIGVVISNKEWMKAVTEGMDKYKQKVR